MSDDLNTFLAKLDRMFEEHERRLEWTMKFYIRNAAAYLIRHTPGPNLQWPDTTEYIATGRLRAAWKLSAAPLDGASRWDGGPYTEHGDDTLSEIEASMPTYLPDTVYLVNDVAYGYVIQEALGRHSEARPGRDWVQLLPLHAPRMLDEAKREAGW